MSRLVGVDGSRRRRGRTTVSGLLGLMGGALVASCAARMTPVEALGLSPAQLPASWFREGLPPDPSEEAVMVPLFDTVKPVDWGSVVLPRPSRSCVAWYAMAVPLKGRACSELDVEGADAVCRVVCGTDHAVVTVRAEPGLAATLPCTVGPEGDGVVVKLTEGRPGLDRRISGRWIAAEGAGVQDVAEDGARRVPVSSLCVEQPVRR